MDTGNEADTLKRLADGVLENAKLNVPPPCCVCGEPLSVQSCGGGEPTRYGCSEWQDDPDEEGKLIRKAGRRCADEHYSKSCWEEPLHLDVRMLDLARAVIALLPMLEILRGPHDSHACERPDGPCYTCGKLAEFDAQMRTLLAAEKREAIPTNPEKKETT